MIILGIDSSSISAAVGVMSDGKMRNMGFCNNGLTHSQTLLPLIDETLKGANVSIKDVDLMCITRGPGSFTGLRIGMATLKGLCAPFDIKCVGVSTLEAICYSSNVENGIICATMDARCGQVYNALFKAENGRLERLSEDRAIKIDELDDELSKIHDIITLCGDGATLCYEKMTKTRCEKADKDHLLINGEALCKLAQIHKDEAIDSAKISPIYLRLPQAQRELKLKKDK